MKWRLLYPLSVATMCTLCFTGFYDSENHLRTHELTGSQLADLESTNNHDSHHITLPNPIDYITLDLDAHYLQSITIARDDHLPQIWQKLALNDHSALNTLQHDTQHQALTRLIPGQQLLIEHDATGKFHALNYIFHQSEATKIIQFQQHPTKITHQIAQQPHETRLMVRNLYFDEQNSTVFSSADAAGVPDSITLQLSDIIGRDLDLYHDFQSGDQLQIAFDVEVNNGDILSYGKIKAVNVNTKKKTFSRYWFGDDKKGQFYDEKGQALGKKNVWRTPLKFTRISSNFSKARFHPILQTWKAHRGVDYAAPQGTPIIATADGVIQIAGDGKGYGNLIVIRHNTKISTFYGHLQRFATKIKPGARVRQGDLIGYVGQTGWATGPHLHYEFRINNEPVDPLLNVQETTAEKLKDQQFKKFIAQQKTLDVQLSYVKNQMHLTAFE